MFYRTIFISILFLACTQASSLMAQDKIADDSNNTVESSTQQKIEKADKIVKIDNDLNKEDSVVPKEIITKEDENTIKSDKTLDETEQTEEVVNKGEIYQPGSLMLSEREYENLKKALSSLVNKVEFTAETTEFVEEGSAFKEEEKSEKSYIYLASLLYFGEKNWVIWINDKKVTSEENDPKNEFYIKNVTKNTVDLVWKLGITKWKIITGKSDNQLPEVNDDNQIVNSFRLKPNQTYILADDQVVEGKVNIGSSSTSSNKENLEDDDNLEPIDNIDEFNFF